MNLKIYLKQECINKNAFARKIPVNPSTLYRWMLGKCKPTALAMERIKELTRGLVKEEDFNNG